MMKFYLARKLNLFINDPKTDYNKLYRLFPQLYRLLLFFYFYYKKKPNRLNFFC